MTDVNGIPNYGFQGGQTGPGYLPDPFRDNQIAMGNTLNNNLSQPIQTFPNYDPFAQSGGFGTMTDYYSSLGASYGRATGGFGGTPGRVGTIGNPGTSNSGYLDSAKYDAFTAGAPPIQHYGGYGGNQVFDTGRYLEQNPDVWKSGATPWEHYNQFGRQEGRQAPWSDIFNSSGYLQANPDVAASGMDPTAHWFEYGQKEGRGGQTFNPTQYLSQNKDVFEAGADPWQHWNQFGQNEGRQGAWSEAFNPTNYAQHNPDVAAAGMDPTAHWFQFGQNEGRQGAGGGDAFNAQEYLLQNRDVAAAGADPLQHWMNFGYKEGREAAFGGTEDADWSKYFTQATQGGGGGNTGRDALAAEYFLNNRDVYDAARASGRDPTEFGLEHLMSFGQGEGRTFADIKKYGEENPDVLAAGMDPTAHWFEFGSKEGRTMPQSSVFNMDTYKLLNPDVAKAGVDPLQHWLTFGQKENRMGGAFESGQMYDQFQGSTYRDPWVAGIPESRRTNEAVTAMKNLAQQYGWDPAALAAVIQMETKNSKLAGGDRISSDSLWNTLTKTGQYHGLTQMGPGTFADAGGKLNGMTYEQYKKATPAQQIATYGAWLDQGAKVGPGTAASLVKGGIGSLPPEMQAAIMMGTQFGPNATSWVKALGEGNMDVPTSTKQAPELDPWTINAMRDVFAKEMAAWPQNQSPWPLK